MPKNRPKDPFLMPQKTPVWLFLMKKSSKIVKKVTFFMKKSTFFEKVTLFRDESLIWPKSTFLAIF
jgi:hypothetical protein